MRILLSNKKPKQAFVLAEDELDQKCLRVLFGNGLIRGAYSFWNGKGIIPNEYLGFQRIQENITAVLAIGSNEDIEDITKEERVSRFKQEMEAEVEKKVTEKKVEAFNFLINDDEPF